MRNREMFVGEREDADTVEWPEDGFEIDDEVFAAAIAEGRTESAAA